MATAKFRIFNNFTRSRVLLAPCLNSSCLKGHSVLLHNSSPSGGTSIRFQNHRRRHGNHRSTSGKTLLDKFIKQLSYDGGKNMYESEVNQDDLKCNHPQQNTNSDFYW